MLEIEKGMKEKKECFEEAFQFIIEEINHVH
jgi:hypothetical protein